MTPGIKLDPFASVLEDFRAGKMVIMVDDEKRENEGDIIVATEAISAEAVSFMMTQCRGLICVSIAVELAQRLNLPLQALTNNSVFHTPFAVSIDHRDVAASGVTAAGRAYSMRKLLDPEAKPSDFVSPGHVFPLIANPAGVLGRQGQTEGSWELARLAGFKASGVLCEILNPDGTMARGPELELFAAKFGLKITSVAELIHHRVHNEVLVREAARSNLRTDFGEFTTVAFVDDVDGKEHLALLYGAEKFGSDSSAPLVRVHSECLTGDVFGSQRCDCGEQLRLAMQRIVEAGSGLIIYLRQEGRGIGLANKLKAYALQDEGSDTVEANVKLGFAPDERDFAVAAKILHALAIRKIRLITNNPEKLSALPHYGIEIEERVPSRVAPTDQNRNYLETKKQKLGHML